MLNKLYILTLFIICLNFGCSSHKEKEAQFQDCTNDWYLQMEDKFSTGDGQGHGPDIGSLEWKSVIEFKLGIRDNPKVPPLDSTKWCDYINSHYIIKNNKSLKRD